MSLFGAELDETRYRSSLRADLFGGIALAGLKTQSDSVDTAATSLAPLMPAPSGGFVSTVMAAKKG